MCVSLFLCVSFCTATTASNGVYGWKSLRETVRLSIEMDGVVDRRVRIKVFRHEFHELKKPPNYSSMQ